MNLSMGCRSQPGLSSCFLLECDTPLPLCCCMLAYMLHHIAPLPSWLGNDDPEHVTRALIRLPSHAGEGGDVVAA
eukprot:4509462-Pleurochrysis_carterae.AAC.1